MNTKQLRNKVAVTIGAATLTLGMAACAHHTATAGDDYGHVRTEASAQNNTSSDQVVGSVPAPSNAQNVSTPSAPAVIAGPAKVDNSGAAYTSSAAGGSGNGSSTGLNTNVNIVPQKSKSSVTVTQTPMSTDTTVAETTPAPAYTAPETTSSSTSTTTVDTTPMASSSTSETVAQTTDTTDTSTTTHKHRRHHRRMRKD